MAEVDDAELEQLKAAAGKVAELEADAAVGRAHREAAEKRIAAEAKVLSAEQRSILDGLPTPALKTSFLEQLRMGRSPPGFGTGGPPAPPESFAEAWKDPESWARAKQRDPEGARRWLESKDPRRGLRGGSIVPGG